MITIERVLFPTPHGPPNIIKCSPARLQNYWGDPSDSLALVWNHLPSWLRVTNGHQSFLSNCGYFVEHNKGTLLSTEKLNSKVFMSYVNCAFLKHAYQKRTLTCLNGGIKMRLDLLVYLGKTNKESSCEKNSGPTHDHHHNPRSLPISSFSYPKSLSYRLTLMPRFLYLCLHTCSHSLFSKLVTRAPQNQVSLSLSEAEQ